MKFGDKSQAQLKWAPLHAFPGASFIHSVCHFLATAVIEPGTQVSQVECNRRLVFSVVLIVSSKALSRQKMERKNDFLEAEVSDQGAFYLLTWFNMYTAHVTGKSGPE